MFWPPCSLRAALPMFGLRAPRNQLSALTLSNVRLPLADWALGTTTSVFFCHYQLIIHFEHRLHHICFRQHIYTYTCMAVHKSRREGHANCEQPWPASST
jgi:hypothetical protein